LQYPAGTPEVALTASDSAGIAVLTSPMNAQVGYKRSAFIGSCKHQVWQAIRASSAAPYYLDDFSDGTNGSAVVCMKLPVFKICYFLFCIVFDMHLFILAMALRCQPLARWSNCGKQSYDFCDKRSTTSVA